MYLHHTGGVIVLNTAQEFSTHLRWKGISAPTPFSRFQHRTERLDGALQQALPGPFRRSNLHPASRRLRHKRSTTEEPTNATANISIRSCAGCLPLRRTTQLPTVWAPGGTAGEETETVHPQRVSFGVRSYRRRRRWRWWWR